MKYILYCTCIFLMFGCAQFVPPTGGPTDKAAPKLLNSNPSNKTKNFHGNTISMDFDEYIDITTLKQELIIVPDPNILYLIKQKDKNVKLVFEKQFPDSTTFTLNYRNGIKDLSERNPSKNLKIVFSTGPEIDSLTLNGIIIDLHTKLPVLDALVGLYKKDTLPLNKKKPDYFMKTDSSGKYLFENIKADKYFIMSFTDKNQNLIFDQKNENIGFIKDTVIVSKNTVIDTLEIYPANYTKNKIKKNISRENEYIIQLDKPTKSATISLDDSSIVTNYDKLNLNFFKIKQPANDTLLAKIILVDSLNISDTISQKIYFANPSKTKRKVQSFPINSSIKNNQELTRTYTYTITFQYPITRFDSSKAIFKTDTVISEKPKYTWINQNTLNIEINTKAKANTQLTFPSNIFENYKGDTNSLFSIKNPILNNDDLGSIEGTTITNAGTKIAQLINEDSGIISKTQTFSNKFNFKNIIPGSYFIKIIFDENNNGIWDPGNINTKKLPEKILVTKESIRIRANFELKDIEIK
ncbi:MAG: Ig-like domain-containing protein [Leadbetterella sp.]|nr:Ig-like domain-containing protein [Leadbetterella sp.]